MTPTSRIDADKKPDSGRVDQCHQRHQRAILPICNCPGRLFRQVATTAIPRIYGAGSCNWWSMALARSSSCGV